MSTSYDTSTRARYTCGMSEMFVERDIISNDINTNRVNELERAEVCPSGWTRLTKTNEKSTTVENINHMMKVIWDMEYEDALTAKWVKTCPKQRQM